MRRKIPLKIKHGEPDLQGQEEQELASEIEARFRFSSLLPEAMQSSLVLAQVACHPGILAESELVFQRGVFAICFARYPDLVIAALAFARQRHKQNQKAGSSASARVCEFFRHTEYVAKKNGQLLDLSKLTIADYQQVNGGSGPLELRGNIITRWEKPGRWKLRPGIKQVPVADLQDGEIAALLFGSQCDVRLIETVKKARQSFAKGKR